MKETEIDYEGLNPLQVKSSLFPQILLKKWLTASPKGYTIDIPSGLELL